MEEQVGKNSAGQGRAGERLPVAAGLWERQHMRHRLLRSLSRGQD